MSRAEFDEFVDRKQKHQVDGAVLDPQIQIAEWQGRLNELYGLIDGFMASYIKDAKATSSRHEITLNEEFSGPYAAPELVLEIGQSTILFKPVGTMLIGSRGRVDVLGPRGNSRLALVDRIIDRASQMVSVRLIEPGAIEMQPPEKRAVDWVWKIITPAPQMRFIELDEGSFFDMILNVADA